uniref:hypothetical protein n=1 Tax=Rheinheimera sp. TaxID=1869214 RepID=UPI004048A1A9
MPEVIYLLLDFIKAFWQLIVAFFAGFWVRYYLYRRKAKVELVNSHISDIENVLRVMFEEAIKFLDSVSSPEQHNDKREIYRQLMVARVRQLRKSCDSLQKIDKKSFTIPALQYSELRRTSDSVFDVPAKMSSLGEFSNACSEFSSSYNKLAK